MSQEKIKITVRRGDLFAITLGQSQAGEELKRPVLIIQNDVGNRFSNSVIIVPLSYKLRAKKLLFSVLIKADKTNGLFEDQVAILSQIRTVEKKHFTPENYLGNLDLDTMDKIDTALALSLGLSTIQKLQTKQYVLKEKS